MLASFDGDIADVRARHGYRALDEALSDWRRLVGDSNVVCRGEALELAGTATFATTARVMGIVRPANRDEVQAAVRIANEHRVPIFAISTGKNWGYGSRVPVRDGVLLDLGRLDRILDFDEDLAYVTVEPGVTQAHLYRFLQERKSHLWMDATGASPECSIIGNTLERGFGHTPMGDHCSNVCGFEVVLPSGDLLKTGFGRVPHARVTALSRWGVGPSFDGLFSQSNFGIVTRMTIWLMPAPDRFAAFFFVCRQEQDLGPAIDALRPLRLNGTLRSVMHIGNAYKVLAGVGQYPWAEMEGRTPLGSADLAVIRQQHSIGAWSGGGALYGTPGQVRDGIRQVRRALRGKVERFQVVDDMRLRLMQRFARPFRVLTGWNVGKTLKVLVPVYNLLKGIPTESTLASAYWRKRTAAPAETDPDRDGCGLLWCSPVMPSRGRDVMAVTDLATTLILSHGFEPQISISLASERMAIGIITISYDRELEGEDERAAACYRALTKELLARGYPPYRLNVSSMGLLDDGPSYARMVHALKQALDPNGIMAPGRYEPVVRTTEEASQPVGAI